MKASCPVCLLEVYFFISVLKGKIRNRRLFCFVFPVKNSTTLSTTCSVLHNNTMWAEYKLRMSVRSNLQQEETHKMHMSDGLMRSHLVMLYLLKRSFDNAGLFPMN